jgi:broad specificity phosphatase PhoE
MRSPATNWSRLFLYCSARVPLISLDLLVQAAPQRKPGQVRQFRGVANTKSNERSGAVRSMTSGVADTSDSVPHSAKELWVLRHGQATHNPRAEAAREAGCSFDEFLELMRQDDSLDADLTDLGRTQAQQVHEIHRGALSSLDAVISSPLSRALHTADLAAPHVSIRVVDESFREINGLLLNAKRRSKSELSRLFPTWSLEGVAREHDEDWTADELEDKRACGERGYHGLAGLMRREEKRMLLVAHGGLLRLVMAEHPNVTVRDGRSKAAESAGPTSTAASTITQQERRAPHARFGNCELRRYRMEWADEGCSEMAGAESGADADGDIRDNIDTAYLGPGPHRRLVDDNAGGPLNFARSEPEPAPGPRRRVLLLTELDLS